MDEGVAFGLGCSFLDGLSHRRATVDGEPVVELDVTDDVRGPGGSLHGGLVSMLVDVAGAVCMSRASGRPVATASTEIQYLHAGRVGPIRASGRALRVSDTLGVAEVRVVDHGRDDRLVAVAHVTFGFLSGDTYVPKTT